MLLGFNNTVVEISESWSRVRESNSLWFPDSLQGYCLPSRRTRRLSKMAAGIRFERMDPLSQIAEFQVPSLKPLDQPAVYNIASGKPSHYLDPNDRRRTGSGIPQHKQKPDRKVLVFGAGGIGMDACRLGGEPMAVSVKRQPAIHLVANVV